MTTTTITMWLCNRCIYDTQTEAIAASREATYGKREEDVQFILDEYIISPYSCRMGEAIAYLENKGLATGRVGASTNGDRDSIYSVAGLKAALGEQGWVEFLTILELNCKVSAVTYKPSSKYKRTIVGVWADI